MFQQLFHYILKGLNTVIDITRGWSSVVFDQNDKGILVHDLISPSDVRERVLKLLRGSQIIIPNPQGLLEGWPAALNQELDKLDEDMQGRLIQ